MNSADDCPPDRTSIVEALEKIAARQPARIAVTHLRMDGDSQSLTYGDLDRRARGIASWLLGRNAQNRRVLLAHPTGLDFIAAFFGCLYAGAHPVPLVSRLRSRHIQRLSAIAADCQATIALSDSATLAQLAGVEAMRSGLIWAASDSIASAGEGDRATPVEVHAVAYLQYTSGSTSLPRGVRISHRNLISNLRELETSYRLGPDDVFVSWLPHFHDMGLVGSLLLSVYLGARCVVFSPLHFMQRPARWLQAISDFRGSFSVAPNFAYEQCLRKITPDEQQPFDLSSWRVAANGAEPIRAETHRRFLATFATNGLRPEALCPCYGLAEATLMVSTSRPWIRARIISFDRDSIARHHPVAVATEQPGALELVGCGPPTDGLEVVIVDPQKGQPVAPGAIGEIWVKGESVAESYCQSPETAADSFGARLPDSDGPYLRTGDLGFLHDGELFITGRLKDLIIIHGRNLYPQDIEHTAQSGRPALVSGRGVAFGVDIDNEERLVLVQEVRSRAAASIIGEVRAAIVQEHEVHPYGILLVARGTIPVTSSGKLARRQTRDLLLKGELEPLAEWYAAEYPALAPQ
jgi:acyl-CoA synthetase (AMP-forming)/AMP-acid ligase II